MSPDVVHLLDLSSGKSRQLKSSKPILNVSCLAFSPDGKSVLVGASDGYIRIWSVQEGKEKFCVAINEWTVSSAAFSPDGRVIAVGELVGNDANLMLLQAETGKAVWVSRLVKGGVIAVAFSPNGGKLAVLGSPGGLYIYVVKEFLKSLPRE